MSDEPVVAIVTGRLDLGEQDRILRLLSPTHGRVGVVARGARRAGSPWASLDLAASVRVRWKARGELGQLLFADVMDPRPRLRESYERLSVALYALELVAAFAREGQPEPKLYGLLEMALLLLDAIDEGFGPSFLASLEAKVLTFAGFAPRLAACARCGGALDGPLRFATEGGVYHLGCAPEEVGLASVTAEEVARLEQLRRRPLKDAVIVDDPWRDEAAELLYRSVVAQLGRPLLARPAR